MNTKMKKVVAGAVLGTFAFGVASPAFAAEASFHSAKEAVAINNRMLESNTTANVADKIAYEIVNGTYDYTGINQEERSVISSGVKTALTFIKNNWPKIQNILKKYGVINVEGKGVIQLIDDILDGVIEVSDNIDEVIYYIVDYIAPGLDSNAKQIIANAIRIILPV